MKWRMKLAETASRVGGHLEEIDQMEEKSKLYIVHYVHGA
jgi:hypothetical protein